MSDSDKGQGWKVVEKIVLFVPAVVSEPRRFEGLEGSRSSRGSSRSRKVRVQVPPSANSVFCKSAEKCVKNFHFFALGKDRKHTVKIFSEKF